MNLSTIAVRSLTTVALAGAVAIAASPTVETSVAFAAGRPSVEARLIVDPSARPLTRAAIQAAIQAARKSPRVGNRLHDVFQQGPVTPQNIVADNQSASAPTIHIIIPSRHQGAGLSGVRLMMVR